jgi:hypothetical protein
LSKFGILDVIDSNITVKALRFKIDFLVKSLVAGKSNFVNQSAETPSEINKSKEKIENNNGLIWRPPLDSEDDIWLIKNPSSDCKKVLGKWLIKLMGPSPYVGQWLEVEGKNQLWRFEFKEKKDLFSFNVGMWFFQGTHKPEFAWKVNRWIITGDYFELAFKTPHAFLSRLRFNGKEILITQNSEFAKSRENDIISSFDKNFVFAQDKLKNSVLEGRTEGEMDLSGDLKGSGATDYLAGNLKGEINQNLQSAEKEKYPHFMTGKAIESKAGNNSLSSEPFHQATLLDLKNDQRSIQTHYKSKLNSSKNHSSENGLGSHKSIDAQSSKKNFLGKSQDTVDKTQQRSASGMPSLAVSRRGLDLLLLWHSQSSTLLLPRAWLEPSKLLMSPRLMLKLRSTLTQIGKRKGKKKRRRTRKRK